MDISTTDIRGPNRHAIAGGGVIGVGARVLGWARIVRAVSCRGYGGWVMFYKTFQNTITVFSRCGSLGVARGRGVLSGLTDLGLTRACVCTCIGGVV